MKIKIPVLSLAFIQIFGALSLLFSTIASAQVTGSITLQSGTYITDVGGSGEYVSPYPALVNFGGLNNVPVYVTCFDKNNTAYIGTTYTGTFNTQFATFSQADVESSYLLDTYLKNETPLSVDHSIASAVSFAVWKLQDPSITIPTADQSLVTSYMNEALAHYTSGYVADNYLFTPDLGSSQRFMIIAPGSSSLGYVPAAPGAPAPPLTACLAFAGVLLLQALRRKSAV